MEPSSKRQRTSGPEQFDFLQGIKAFVVLTGIGKARSDLFKRQLLKNGGDFHDKYSDDSTNHVIVDENMDVERLCKIMKWDKPPDPKTCSIVKSLWLSACLKGKTLVDVGSYQLDVNKYFKEKEEQKQKEKIDEEKKLLKAKPTPSTSKLENNDETCGERKNSESEIKPTSLPKVGVMYRAFKKKVVQSEEGSDVDSDYNPSGEEEGGATSSGEETELPSSSHRHKHLPKGNWVCAQSSLAPRENHNRHITDKLEALAKTYENTNDKWRALGYAKAISAVRAYPKEITTFEEAKALRGVGNRLAEKIWEIIESGELRKLNELSSSEEIQAINLFTNIWGAGATTARTWVAQGLRTLDDLKERGNLTRHQKIGLQYYDELLDRMSREEAAKIEQKVKEAAHSIDKDLVCMAQGSYRRGKTTCGDVDVLITHPDGKSHKGVFSKLLNTLRDSGFITDDLVCQEDTGNQKKYLGVCKLPGEDTFHRRLDIIVVPYDEFACASMYFTGSAHFNRSMRNLAGKMGMSLNEHGLFAGVVRKGGEKINKGYPLKTPTEESVFKQLGLTYRPPEERNH